MKKIISKYGIIIFILTFFISGMVLVTSAEVPATHTVTFTVISSGNPLEGVSISVFESDNPGPSLEMEGPPVIDNGVTDGDGIWATDIEDGEYLFLAQKEGYSDSYGSFTVAGEDRDVLITKGGAPPSLGFVNYEYYDIKEEGDVVIDLGPGVDIKSVWEEEPGIEGNDLESPAHYTYEMNEGMGEITIKEDYLATGFSDANIGDELELYFCTDDKGTACQPFTIIAINPVTLNVGQDQTYSTVTGALAAAKPGDTIEITETATFMGTFDLRARHANGEGDLGHDLVTIEGVNEGYDEEGERLMSTIGGHVGFVENNAGRGPLGVTFKDLYINGNLSVSYGAVVDRLYINGNLDASESGQTTLNNGQDHGMATVFLTEVNGDVYASGNYINIMGSDINGDFYVGEGVTLIHSDVYGFTFGKALSDFSVLDNEENQLKRGSSSNQDVVISFSVAETNGDYVGVMGEGETITIVFHEGLEINTEWGEKGIDWTITPDVFDIDTDITGDKHKIEMEIKEGEQLSSGQEVVLTINNGITETPNVFLFQNEIQRNMEENMVFDSRLMTGEQAGFEIRALRWNGEETANPSSLYYNYRNSSVPMLSGINGGSLSHQIRFVVDFEDDFEPTTLSVRADFDEVGGGKVPPSSCSYSEILSHPQGEPPPTGACSFLYNWTGEEDNKARAHIIPIEVKVGDDWWRIDQYIVVDINPRDMGYQLAGDTTDWTEDIDDFTAVPAGELKFNRLEGEALDSTLIIDEEVNLTILDIVWAMQDLGENLAIAQDSMALAPALSALEGFDGAATLILTGFGVIGSSSPSVQYIPDSFEDEPGDPVLVVDEGLIIDSDKINSFDYTEGTVTIGIEGWSKYLVLDLKREVEADGTVVIDNNVPNHEIEFKEDAEDPVLDFGDTDEGSKTIPQVTIKAKNANNVRIDIPATTAQGTGWDGKINAPTITEVTLPTEAGKSRTLSTAIQIGFSGGKINFDDAVRILIPGEAGKKIGYTRDGDPFTEITQVCEQNNQTWANENLGSDDSCKIDVGDDLVVWTKHFTKFATYTETTVSSSGSSSRRRTDTDSEAEEVEDEEEVRAEVEVKVTLETVTSQKERLEKMKENAEAMLVMIVGHENEEQLRELIEEMLEEVKEKLEEVDRRVFLLQRKHKMDDYKERINQVLDAIADDEDKDAVREALMALLEEIDGIKDRIDAEL